MNTSYKTSTEFSALDYVVLVNQIATHHFLDNGEYAPHLGLLNTMKIFYDNCVTECPLDAVIRNAEDKPDDLTAVTMLAADNDFVEAFNDALVSTDRSLNFANAYVDAMKIVETKKSSMNMLLTMAQNWLQQIVDRIAPALTEENIKAMQTIAKGITENVPAADAVVKAYADSELLKTRAENKE